MLAERATAADLPALLEIFFTNESLSIQVAQRVLRLLQLPEAVPPLAHYVEQFDDHDDARYAYYRLNAIRRILAANPAALPLARAWLDAGGWARPSAALSILAKQSEACDVPKLRQLLASAIVHEPGEVPTAYYTEGCLKGLKPFAEQVPYAELATVYERTWSTWTRREAAALLAAGHPELFAGGYAVDCLWDCEGGIVEIGCACVDLSMPGVRVRLEQLRQSPWQEEDAGRRAAAERLQEIPS